MERLWLSASLTACEAFGASDSPDQEHIERKSFSGKRALKIGLATLGGGTALALTGASLSSYLLHTVRKY